MSKSLENEYKELIAEDVPDLWERIEAGLEPKHPAAEKRSLWRKYRVWGAVAACLCLAVTVPAIFIGNGAGSSNASEKLTDASCDFWADGMAGTSSEDIITMEEVSENSIDNNATVNEAPVTYDEEAAVDESHISSTIRARVLEVSATERGTVYTVMIEEADSTGLFPEDEIKLYAGESLEELAEGEAYLLDISAVSADNDIAEYLIKGVR